MTCSAERTLSSLQVDELAVLNRHEEHSAWAPAVVIGLAVLHWGCRIEYDGPHFLHGVTNLGSSRGARPQCLNNGFHRRRAAHRAIRSVTTMVLQQFNERLQRSGIERIAVRKRNKTFRGRTSSFKDSARNKRGDPVHG